MLRLTLTILLLWAALPAAQASECMDEVRALFSSSLDPFQRPAYRSQRTHFDEAGAKKSAFQNVVQTPLRTISLVEGGAAALVVDQDTWTGPTLDGPWTSAPSTMPDNRRAAMEMSLEQQVANLSEPACDGEVEVDGQQLLKYSFTTKTDPNPDQGGLWFGSSDTIYIDPATGQVMLWERTGFTSSFAPTPTAESSVETFEYDDAITVDPPA
jgi:hypothetical protein